ncbi:BCCT family transporter, partial [Escherichia coli]|uniref:BCCT family transporter n=1 Tax=Escherichia coli TaxID=562 RepID=UPI002735DEEE
VAEPMSHYVNPALPSMVNRAKEAQLATFFHWGIHAWSIFAVMGLILAYFSFRYKLPLSIRSGLYPILKERINGKIGDIVDIFALVSTFF